MSVGITIMAPTRRTPTIRIATTTVSAVKRVSIRLSPATGTPLVRARSSLRVTAKSGSNRSPTVVPTTAVEGDDEPEVRGAHGEDAAEEDREEVGVEAAGEADQHHREREAAGQEHRERGVAAERAARPEALHAHRAEHGHHQRADHRRQAEEEPERHAGEGHVGQGVGDEREPARDQEDADGRADDRGHGAGHEGAMHEAVLEELGQRHQWSWLTTRTAGP